MDESMRDVFNQKFDVFQADKAANAQCMTRLQYDNIMQTLVRIATTGLNAKNRTDVFRKDRYEIQEMTDGETGELHDRLVNKRTLLEIVHNDEMFDVLQVAHRQTGHGGRDKMKSELGKKYHNVSKEVICLFLSMCQECQVKLMKRKGLLSTLPSKHTGQIKIETTSDSLHNESQFVHQESMSQSSHCIMRNEFSSEESKLLIDLWCSQQLTTAEQLKQMGDITSPVGSAKRCNWDQIITELQFAGFERTVDQCKNKINSLRYLYKRAKLERSTGNVGAKSPFFDQLECVFNPDFVEYGSDSEDTYHTEFFLEQPDAGLTIDQITEFSQQECGSPSPSNKRSLPHIQVQSNLLFGSHDIKNETMADPNGSMSASQSSPPNGVNGSQGKRRKVAYPQHVRNPSEQHSQEFSQNTPADSTSSNFGGQNGIAVRITESSPSPPNTETGTSTSSTSSTLVPFEAMQLLVAQMISGLAKIQENSDKRFYEFQERCSNEQKDLFMRVLEHERENNVTRDQFLSEILERFQTQR